MNEPVGEREKLFLLLLSRFEARLDQFDDDAAGARALSLREGLDSTNNARRKADTLANGRLRRNHIVMVHHSAPDCITYDYRAASTWRSYCPFR